VTRPPKGQLSKLIVSVSFTANRGCKRKGTNGRLASLVTAQNEMKRITNVWTWIRIQMRDLRPQLQLCLRVTVAALLSFVLGRSLNIPLCGLWAALTAVVVAQMSIGGSLQATIEYLIGTFGGAVYAGMITLLIQPADEIPLLIALAITVAPLALLAALKHKFSGGAIHRSYCGYRFVAHP
jgi:uncharacterized membrane protein YccC